MMKEEAYKKLEELIHKFEEHYDSYHKQEYNETLARRDFIEPFFKILNWDIDNEQGYAQSYRDVIHEDKVKVGKETKAPDYAFRIGGKIVFYVEAKKPSIELKDNAEPAYQVRRYGWSAKLGISVLGNFEELAIYDCSKKPSSEDKASTARIKYITYKDYLKEFDFLWGLFNKENVLKGSLEKYTLNLKDKKGTEEVDKEFLASLDNFREKLASNISKLNADFSSRDINFTVQQTIDRIIFLKIAEDRGIENYGVLRDALNGENYYKNMFNIFLEADGKYNSGLFDFSKDTISKKTIIDNKVIKEIVNDLYYPKSPYEFSVLPVEILGSAYEQFLGKTITITGNHKAKIEYKPEVRKAGGVYYTPEYIVDYIVQNTVGAIIKNKTPKEIEKIKIVDPACGSGSFLLGAYKYLLSYHKKYYNEKNLKDRGTKDDVLTPTGELTTRVKKSILINNIYGVDIDVNAVEVTKLSLLIKCLEGETPQSLQSEKILFNERALPSLEENIKCGNSLIGSDFYSQGNFDLDEETMHKINCFDWEKAFSSVFKSGGFDCVIGNPPYFNIQTLGHNSPIAEYIMQKHSHIWQDKSDILFYFLSHGINISRCKLGFIISNSFLFADKAKKLRNFILEKGAITRIVNFEKFQVFKSASITTAIVIFDKDKENKNTQALVLEKKEYENITELLNEKKLYRDVTLLKDSVFSLHKEEYNSFLNKISNNVLLGNIFYVGKGMETAANDVYSFSELPIDIPSEYIRKRMSGEMIERYYTRTVQEYILYIEDVNDFKSLPKNVQDYLKTKKKILEKRATVSYEGRSWWKYSRPMHKEMYHLNKIWCSYRSKSNKFTLDESSDFIGLTNTTVIFQTNEDINLK